MGAALARPQADSRNSWAGLWEGPPPLHSAGTFALRLVGTYYYQEALADLYGPRCPQGVRVEDDGHLVTEDENPFDPNAIALVVGGQMLGHLSRADATDFRRAMALALFVSGRFPTKLLVTGGLSTGIGRSAQFDVHLDLITPFSFA